MNTLTNDKSQRAWSTEENAKLCSLAAATPDPRVTNWESIVAHIRQDDSKSQRSALECKQQYVHPFRS